MRKNTRQTVEAFLEGKARRPANSIWTNGDHIWSYGTMLVERHPTDPRSLVFNATKYSPTTSQHQRGLRAVLEKQYHLTIVTGCPFGVSDLYNHGA